MNPQGRRAEAFLDEMERRLGPTTIIRQIGPASRGLPPVAVLQFKDRPRPGLLTSVTYGLSVAAHPLWKHGTCELVVSLETQDESWGLAAGFFAASFRGEKPFEFQSLFSLDEPISEESPMTAFFVFAAPLTEGLGDPVELPDGPVHLAGMYPLHPQEVELFQAIGLAEFWDLPDFDIFSVRRPPVRDPRAGAAG